MTPGYHLQTAPSTSSALSLLLFSLINGLAVLREEELSGSSRALPAGRHCWVRAWASSCTAEDSRPLTHGLCQVGVWAPAPGMLAVALALSVILLIRALGDKPLSGNLPSPHTPFNQTHCTLTWQQGGVAVSRDLLWTPM